MNHEKQAYEAIARQALTRLTMHWTMLDMQALHQALLLEGIEAPGLHADVDALASSQVECIAALNEIADRRGLPEVIGQRIVSLELLHWTRVLLEAHLALAPQVDGLDLVAGKTGDADLARLTARIRRHWRRAMRLSGAVGAALARRRWEYSLHDLLTAGVMAGPA